MPSGKRILTAITGRNLICQSSLSAFENSVASRITIVLHKRTNMKIAISSKGTFNSRWIKWCSEKNIIWKPVDCYRNDIIQQMVHFDALLWHFSQGSPKDFLFAKQLIFALQISGKKVFPDISTSWHFDDKVGQKYLLEAIGAPLVPTWIFYEKKEALKWVEKAVYPKVFKLRSGAGSQNVHLVRSKHEARRLVRKAFGRGFVCFDPKSSLQERIRKFKTGNKDILNIAEGLIRFVIPPRFSKFRGRERGYIYFQEFIPGNDHDIRVVVIGENAFALKRMVRDNDFRASGSGKILYERENFSETTIELAFSVAEKLKTQCLAFDFIYKMGESLITEISYGFSPEAYDQCPGYWSRDLRWHEGKFNPYGWIVENMINKD